MPTAAYFTRPLPPAGLTLRTRVSPKKIASLLLPDGTYVLFAKVIWTTGASAVLEFYLEAGGRVDKARCNTPALDPSHTNTVSLQLVATVIDGVTTGSAGEPRTRIRPLVNLLCFTQNNIVGLTDLVITAISVDTAKEIS